jgi:hypothetical protein
MVKGPKLTLEARGVNLNSVPCLKDSRMLLP